MRETNPNFCQCDDPRPRAIEAFGAVQCDRCGKGIRSPQPQPRQEEAA